MDVYIHPHVYVYVYLSLSIYIYICICRYALCTCARVVSSSLVEHALPIVVINTTVVGRVRSVISITVGHASLCNDLVGGNIVDPSLGRLARHFKKYSMRKRHQSEG